MKLLTVLGARPQIVKAAVVSRAFHSFSEVSEILVHTGQHYDEQMSSVFFSELDAPKPSYNLGIGSGGQGIQTGRMLETLEPLLIRERPDCVLVYGDTNSTLAGALSAAKLHIPVAHVEAGLRSFNRAMPEEINRVVTDHISDLLFAPTQTAWTNLSREGISDSKVISTGDVMFDAALYYSKKAQNASTILTRLNVEPGSYVLSTIHRAENTDDQTRLKTIVEALHLLSRDVRVILPLHPRTRKALLQAGLLDCLGRSVSLLEPVGYLDMFMLEQGAVCIATDSGGVQKEAFFCSVPCVTLRDETEWTELVDVGWNRLVSPTSDPRRIAEVIKEAGKSRPPVHPNLYGDGNAGMSIAKHLVQRYS